MFAKQALQPKAVSYIQRANDVRNLYAVTESLKRFAHLQ